MCALMKGRTLGLAFVVLIFGVQTASANILTINGVIDGIVNGEAIGATTIGSIDTTGAGGGSVAITFTQIPTNFHPAALSWSLLSVACGNGLVAIDTAENLFALTGGSYAFTRMVSYPAFPGSALQTTGNVTTVGNALTYNLTVSGNYAGPTDLTGVSNYQAVWAAGAGNTITETGGATINQLGGGSFQDVWTTSYSTGGAALPSPEIVSITFTTQEFDGTTLDLAFQGTVQAIPEPSVIALMGLGLGVIGAFWRGTQRR